MSTIIFESACAQAVHYPEKRLIILSWQGNPTTEEYMKPFLAMADFGSKHPVDSMLSDISRQGVINPENRKWFEREIMPRSLKNGLQRAAIVTNGNVFKIYYINVLLNAVNKFNIATKVFNNQADAIKWIDGFEFIDRS